MVYADSISDAVNRWHLGYYTFPTFQVYMDYAGGKTELVIPLL